MERGRLGDKTGQGFYKKPPKGAKGDILTLDLETMEYRERREPDIPSIKEAMKIKPLGDTARIRPGAGRQGGRARASHCLQLAGLRRAAHSRNHRSNHQRGQCSALGLLARVGTVRDVGRARRAANSRGDGRAQGIEVAPWVKEMLAAGHETFYRSDNGRLSYYDPARKTYVAEACGRAQDRVCCV